VEHSDSRRSSLTQARASDGSLVILGCRVDRVDSEAAVARIEQLLDAAMPAQVVTLGAEMANLAHDDARYRSVINSASLVLPDTIGIVLASRWIGTPLPERVAGIDLIERLCALAAARCLPVYLLGSGRSVARAAGQALMQRHAGLRIVGTEHGYFDDAQSNAICERIRAAGARLVLVGLGFPRQEYWIHDHLAQLGAAVCMGVGGSFDVLSGMTRRAPLTMRRMGLEWLYRLIREPSRLRRQLALPLFAARAAGQALRARVGASRAEVKD
jgi:N-acetylglucosaminyldiphosphoundecaprenol N-acetyl-beta-D-mannosaminyltransferase